MKTKTSLLPLNVLYVYLISLCYWIFLSFKGFSIDLIGYKDFGSIFYRQGLIGYVATGLHREPLYPLLCSLAIHIEHLSGIGFIYIMDSFSIIMLMITQILIYTILRGLNIRPWICSLMLFYWAVSPSITNSAFHILFFCEIITYPLILLTIITAYQGWKVVEKNRIKEACLYGVLTGILFALTTFVKAVFECIFPVYLIFFLLGSLYKNKASISLICFLTAAGVLFYLPITGYKSLNKMYNGHFAITNRGDWAFYGVAAHRVRPLKNYLINLYSVPGEETCTKVFQTSECDSANSGISDNLGTDKMHELTAMHLPPQAISEHLLELSVKQILTNPPQYILLSATEGLKALFWENAGGPSLRFMMAILTFFVLIYCSIYYKYLPLLMKVILAFIFLFVFFHSFFDTLPRYFLPIVPLYIICIGHCLDSLF